LYKKEKTSGRRWVGKSGLGDGHDTNTAVINFLRVFHAGLKRKCKESNYDNKTGERDGK